MDQCVRIMRDTFLALRNGTASNQPRRRINLDTGSALHSMGGVYGKYFGTKFYTSNPKYGSHFFFYLFDAETARPLAQFEANYLGQIRTGAASGYEGVLADRFLARYCAAQGLPLESKVFSREAIDHLVGYHWPGNIRELESTVSRAALSAPGRAIRTIDVEFLSA